MVGSSTKEEGRIIKILSYFYHRGVAMPRVRGMTDEMIVEKHQAGASYKELQAFSGLSDRAIRNVLVKHGVPLRKQYAGQPRKYQVNEHFFKTWSHEMAWVLGMFVTDGHVNEQLEQIEFVQKDTSVLELVAEYMNADKHITRYNRTPRFTINSKIMKQDLINMGITSNKSHVLPFTQVPEEYLPSFIRGVIDGDGWVQDRGYVMNVTTASIDFANGLHDVFTNWGLRSEIKQDHHSNGIYRVWVKGKRDIARLSEIIYNTPLKTNCLLYKQERMSQRKDLLVDC